MGETLVMTDDVQSWDLTDYPMKDPRNQKAGSTYFKFHVLDKNGRMEHKIVRAKMRDAAGNEIQVDQDMGPKSWGVTGGIGDDDGYQGQPQSFVAEVDLRRAEKEVGGKPSEVLMGLFFHPEINEEGQVVQWLEQDRKKEFIPKWWRNVTDQYYDEWRPKAYAKVMDPFKGQHRPYTKLQEMAQENKSLREKLEKENAELKAKLAARP